MVWVAAMGCADGRGLPTSPSATATVSGSPATVQGTAGPAAHAVLLLTKTCDAIDHCTVITWSSGPCPVGSEVTYAGPLLETRTASGIRVTTPSVITRGTGALAALHANIDVSSDADFVVFTWHGR